MNLSLRNISLKNMTIVKLSSLHSQLTLHLLIKVNQADRKTLYQHGMLKLQIPY